VIQRSISIKEKEEIMDLFYVSLVTFEREVKT